MFPCRVVDMQLIRAPRYFVNVLNSSGTHYHIQMFNGGAGNKWMVLKKGN